MANSIIKLLISRLIAFVIFIILIGLLNVLSGMTDNLIFDSLVSFFNSNIIFITWIFLIMVIAEMFMSFDYPFNIPGPAFNAVGAVLIVVFLGELFLFLKWASNFDVNLPFETIFLLIAVLVFIVVLFAGYYEIYKNIPRKTKPIEVKEKPRPVEKQVPKKKVKKTKKKKK